MKNIIEFLSQLKENNNREWFTANKSLYKEVEKEFNAFAEKLIEGIAKFDSSIKNLTAKDCTFRIYRDVRFSPNKEPYKTHMAAYICPNGKKSGLAGYYFHVEAPGANFIGGHLLATGVHNPEPKVLQSIREEILDNGDAFLKAIKHAKGFELDESSKLKKVPKDFPQDYKHAEYLKLKNYSLMKFVSDDFLMSDNLLENCLTEFRKSLEFNHILNRAAHFAFEEI
ncbi:uncharacterized protein (TIGR02453 family) [Dysgonomonas alginatilytica]|uniref:Uncharacterized protein (TIGR02453 family) n=1 Tax=Dysgonomonas alginatilytica TaxID=1605892 RepID=A0A2V3PTT5_9BACT|nr:DUF2461 domain-containing protein [Dysgonomonas alginatilytica]PXV69019.1 uncharacterized protein (TIGR02453 family) [Dysgonomonas alginatilytica]